jgi:hypothetical protein
MGSREWDRRMAIVTRGPDNDLLLQELATGAAQLD